MTFDVITDIEADEGDVLEFRGTLLRILKKHDDYRGPKFKYEVEILRQEYA